VLPALVAALHDDNASVRAGAAATLAQLGPDAREALEAVEEACRDTDEAVRKQAETAVQKIRGQRLPAPKK
jgi:HEAT repeat protein